VSLLFVFTTERPPPPRLLDRQRRLVHVITHPTKMRRYKIVPWILFILSITNVTLTAPVLLREIRHACVDVMDVREDAIPVSRSEKQNDELENLWDKPSPAMHPRTSPTPSESDYGTAPDPHNSYQTATSELQETPSGEDSESSFESESHRISDDEAPSEGYLASAEGGSGSSKSFSFSPSNLPVELEPEPEPVAGSNPSASGLPTTSSPGAELKSGSQKSFLSKLASKSKSFLSKLASKSKNFLVKLAGKLKFWRRTSSESVSVSGPATPVL
jgi:hypothetical protein